MIKTESLLYLTKVAQYSSISAAADEINITPSAITHSLKQLENELGLPLYERTSKGIRLTSDGVNIAQIAEGVLNNIDAMKQYAKRQLEKSINTAIPLEGHAILCSFQLMNEALTPLYFDMKKEYSDFDISLSEISNFNKMLNSIDEDNEVFGLFYVIESDIKAIFQQHPFLEYHALSKTFFSLRLAANSKLVPHDTKELNWKEVSQLPLIFTSDSSFSNNSIIQHLQKYNSHLNVSYSAVNTSMYIESIKNDLAASIKPYTLHHLNPEIESIYKSIPIRGDNLYVSLIFIYNKSANSAVVNTLIDKIMKLGI